MKRALLLLILLLGPLYGQPADQPLPQLQETVSCDAQPYHAGCSFLGLGLILGADDAGSFIWGGRLKYGYFMIDRLALVGNAEFIFASATNQYETGPDLVYFIGPFFGWTLAPGYGVRYLWVTKAFNTQGFVHGPIGILETRISRNLTIGVEVFHNLANPIDGDANVQTRVSPIIRYAF